MEKTGVVLLLGMKKERLIEIIDLLIDNLKSTKKENSDKTGICKAINNLFYDDIILYTEEKYIKTFFNINKPAHFNVFNSFVDGKYWTRSYGYWWVTIKEEPKAKRVRIKYLRAVKTEIEKTTKL